MATSTTLSPAGQFLQLGGSPASLANPETDEERKRRLASIAAAQKQLGTTPGALSAAGQALGLGGYSGI